MRISHYNDSVPLWEEFTKTTAELSSWLKDVEAQFASESCQSGDAIQTANAIDVVQSLMSDATAKRNDFQQLRPLAGWTCVWVCVHVCGWVGGEVGVGACMCVCISVESEPYQFFPIAK